MQWGKLHNLTKSSLSIWQYVVSVKSMVKIFSNFEAFLEYTNFITFLLSDGMRHNNSHLAWAGFKIKVNSTLKNLEEKDGQRLILYYVSLIRACNKVLYQLV